MSRTKPSDIDELAMRYPCPYCTKPSGDWCVTSGGEWATWLHGHRTDTIREAWGLGYEENEHYLVQAIQEESPWVARIVARHRCALCAEVTA